MTYSVATFSITNEDLKQFKRFIKKPMDCVINVLNLLNIIDRKTADILRITVGYTGLEQNQIEELFAYFYPNGRWRFYSYTNIDTLVHYCQKELPINHVIFCGITNKKESHVFLIGKTQNGELIFIDPSIDLLCDLADIQCARILLQASRYYILQGTIPGTQVQMSY